MRSAFDIAARDLRARLRNRSAIVTAFIAPLVLAIILSLALGSTDEVSVTLAVADLDGGQIGEGLIEGIGDDGPFTLLTVVDADAVVVAIEDGVADAGLIIPAGATGAVTSGERATIRAVRGEGELSAELAIALARGTAAQIERGRRVNELALRSGADPQTAGAFVAAALAADPAVILIDDDQVPGSLTGPASYFGPAMAVFFVFFVVGAGPQSLLRQRKEGSLARLAAAPIPRWSILVGTALSVLVLALACIATLWLVMSLGFGASWGNPVGVVVLALAITIAAAAITTLVATLARTEEQVSGYTSIIVFTLALLGGSFGVLPPQLEPLSLATPNGQALRGFVDLAAGGGLEVVVMPVLAVLAFAVVALAIALPRADRLVTP